MIAAMKIKHANHYTICPKYGVKTSGVSIFIRIIEFSDLIEAMFVN